MSADAATLGASFPRTGAVADLALIGAGAAFVAVAAQVAVPLPFTPVPLSGQTFAVVLVGSSLGGTRGLASLLVYIAVGVAGAPIYADGTAGWAVLSGPTGGYIIGFALAATVAGLLANDSGIAASPRP